MGTAPLLEIRRGEIEGIPLFWADAELPFLAAFLFRVGMGDETLASAGVTHLVEHLALPAARLRGLDFNGQVDGTATVFWASGERASVLSWLEQTAKALSELPVDRLEPERSILLTELESWGPGHPGGAAALRFGARGYGLIGHPQYGLYCLTREDVEAWARERFTRQNAALYVVGEPPGSLELGLPEGTRTPLPAQEPIADVRYPSVYAFGPSGSIAASFLVPRLTAAQAGLSIAAERIREQLRYRGGVTYGVESWYDPVTSEQAHSILWADAMEHNVTLVRNGVLTALSDLADHGPTDEELVRETEAMRASAADPTALPSYLYMDAHRELTGADFLSPAALVAEYEALRPADVAGAVADAFDTLLLVLPEGVSVPGGRFQPYPKGSTGSVEGRRFRRRRSRLGRRQGEEVLTVGEEGITLRGADLTVTITFVACEALLRWEEGDLRTLIARDGSQLFIDPTEWAGGREIVTTIDSRVGAERTVPMEGPPPFEDADLLAGSEALDEGRPADATRLLRSGLEREPENGLAWNALAAAYLALEDGVGAVEASREASRLMPTLPSIQFVHAQALRSVGRLTEAAASARRALELDPSDVGTLSGAAALLAETGERAEARRAMERLVELHPDDPFAFGGLGWAAQALGDWDQAIDYFRRALALEPKDAMTHNNLGWTYLVMGRPKEALRELETALKLDPEARVVRWNRVFALELAGGSADAAREFDALIADGLLRTEKQAADHPDSAEPLLQRSRYLGQANRIDEALDVLHEALRLAPDDGLALAEVALRLAYVGRFAEARTFADRAVAAQADDVDLHFARAWTAAVAGEPAIAAEAADEAARLVPDHPRTHFARGLAHVAEERWEEARDALGQAVAAVPLDCCANRWLAYVARRLGDETEAERRERTARAIAPRTTCLGAFADAA